MRDLLTINIKSPCLGCKDRDKVCHDYCVSFAEYREEVKKQRDYIRLYGQRMASVYAGKKAWGG